ncbi:MAG: alpha/beta fold hydrolase [Acidobacteria bacterium]|nr:alpha/beta fold hydrolase [Acidobacteriota bacterium]
MPFATAGSRRIHYAVLGEPGAPPLLLIMGMSFSSRAWDALPGRLAGRFRVILFDNAGTGRSDPPSDALSMATMAADAVAVLDAEGIACSHVFGISMGGMIALHLVLRHPERVAALVLGATFAGWRRSLKPTLRTQMDLLVGNARARRGRGLGPLASVLVSRDFLAAPEGGLAAFASFLSRAEPATPRIVLRQLGAILRHDTDSRLATIAKPTLVITGDADRLVPPGNSAKLARSIPGSRLVELPGAGHCFPLERPDESARHLLEFLEANPA